MPNVVILASLTTNRDPVQRIHVFETVFAYISLEAAIQAAKFHYFSNFNPPETVPQFRVYQAYDPDGSTHALLEVSDGRGDMSFVALYKIVADKYQFTSGTQPESFGSGISGTSGPGPSGLPPTGPFGQPLY